MAQQKKLTAKQKSERIKAAQDREERANVEKERKAKVKKTLTVIVVVILVLALSLPTMGLMFLGSNT